MNSLIKHNNHNIFTVPTRHPGLITCKIKKQFQNFNQTFYTNITPFNFNNLPLTLHWTLHLHEKTHPLPPNNLHLPFCKANPPFLYAHPTHITWNSPNICKNSNYKNILYELNTITIITLSSHAPDPPSTYTENTHPNT